MSSPHVVVATGSNDRFIRLWRVGNGEQICALPFQQDDGGNKLHSQVNCLALTPDKRYLCAGGYGMLHIYDVHPIYAYSASSSSSRAGRGPSSSQQHHQQQQQHYHAPVSIMASTSNTDHGHTLNVTSVGFFRSAIPSSVLKQQQQQNQNDQQQQQSNNKLPVMDLCYSTSEDCTVKIWEFGSTSPSGTPIPPGAHHLVQPGAGGQGGGGANGGGVGQAMRLIGTATFEKQLLTCSTLLCHPPGSFSADSSSNSSSNNNTVVNQDSILFVGTQNGTILALSLHKLLKHFSTVCEMRLNNHNNAGNQRGQQQQQRQQQAASSSALPVVNIANSLLFCIKMQKDSTAIRSLAMSPCNRFLIAANNTGVVFTFKLSGGNLSTNQSFAEALKQSFSSNSESSHTLNAGGGGANNTAATAATKPKKAVTLPPTDSNGNLGVTAAPGASLPMESDTASNTEMLSQHSSTQPTSKTSAALSAAQAAANEWCETPSYCTLVSAFHAHHKYILRATVSRDGRLLATASADCTVKLWEIPSALTATKQPTSGTVTPGATAAASGNASVASGSHSISNPFPPPASFSTEPWKALKEVTGHSRWVWDCTFSNCSTYLVTGSSDNTGRLWQIGKDPVKLTTSYNGHDKPVTCVVLNDVAESQ